MSADRSASAPAPAPAPRAERLWARLPAFLRPLERERTGRGVLRRAESAGLLLAGLLLALATVNDVARQTHINHRLVTDVETWRAATGHRYRDLAVDQDREHRGTHETVCGNVSPGPSEERTRVCLSIEGRTLHGLRVVAGGYYLPPTVEDLPAERYGCFGDAARTHLCGAAAPPAGAPPATPIRLGRP